MANSGRVNPSTSAQVAERQVAERIQIEAERMQDVQLLLENLLIREEETAKLILDRLYDIASVNWINRNLPYPSLNQFTKWIAKLTKPAFKLVALRWVKRNCPPLITDWLYSQVKFQPKPVPTLSEDASAIQIATYKIAECNREISQLQSRVRLLSILLVAVTCTLGGAILWSVRFAKPEIELAPLQSTSRPRSPELAPGRSPIP